MVSMLRNAMSFPAMSDTTLISPSKLFNIENGFIEKMAFCDVLEISRAFLQNFKLIANIKNHDQAFLLRDFAIKIVQTGHSLDALHYNK